MSKVYLLSLHRFKNNVVPLTFNDVGMNSSGLS